MKSSEWHGYNLIIVRMHMCKRTIQISYAGMRDFSRLLILSFFFMHQGSTMWWKQPLSSCLDQPYTFLLCAPSLGTMIIPCWFILGDNENENKQTGEEKPKELKICAHCGEKIEGKFLLRALDQFWHEECLKCSYCNTQLADLSFKFYHKGDLVLCKRDYIRWAFLVFLLVLLKIK